MLAFFSSARDLRKLAPTCARRAKVRWQAGQSPYAGSGGLRDHAGAPPGDNREVLVGFQEPERGG